MAVVEALLQVRFTPLQFRLMVFVFHCGWWYQAGYSQNPGPPEVVTFSRITGSWRAWRPPGWVSYSLHFGGQKHIIHMKINKNLLARHMPVFTYTDQGALLEDRPFVQSDCFYHGYVEGDPESLVALTSCFGGFRGMLQVHEMVYEIKAKYHSNTLEHLVYRMESEETSSPMRCGLTDEEIERQLRSLENENSTLMQSAYKGWYTHRWFPEMVVVVDHYRYRHSDRNVSNVYTDVCIVMNEVSLLIQSLDADLILVGIDVWTTHNPVNDSNLHVVAREFCRWKIRHLGIRVEHDVIHLFIKQNFSRRLGVAYQSGLCFDVINCGVDSFLGDWLSDFAITVSHELGHNFGMPHDTTFCTCGDRSCIMYASKGDGIRFSNCSYNAFWNHLSKITCVREPPSRHRIFKHARCGNRLVEDGEECDCGSFKSCASDQCCLSDCTLTPGAECAFGLCCHDCQIMTQSLECRKNESECDLPEWCTGTSFYCPEDVYVQDGTPCAGGSGYCYEKRCNNRDEQCKKIFGKGAKSANHRCYRELNVRGDRFGHCGLDLGMIRCNNRDILCGRLQCDNVTKIPTLRDHTTVHWTQLGGISCWGTDYHFGMTIPDIGDVKDGTECGTQFICINRQCVHKSFLTSSCSRQFCNMSGVCNNRHNCHCNFGWAPPKCMEPGKGGSVDSGPPPNITKQDEDQDQDQDQDHEKEREKTMHALFYTLFLPVLILILCLVIISCKRFRRKREETSPEDESS